MPFAFVTSNEASTQAVSRIATLPERTELPVNHLIPPSFSSITYSQHRWRGTSPKFPVGVPASSPPSSSSLPKQPSDDVPLFSFSLSAVARNATCGACEPQKVHELLPSVHSAGPTWCGEKMCRTRRVRLARIDTEVYITLPNTSYSRLRPDSSRGAVGGNAANRKRKVSECAPLTRVHVLRATFP